MGYRRYFVAMTHDGEGYNYRGKTPAGRCIIEARDGVGRLNLNVQSLKPEINYKLYIIFKDTGKSTGIPAGSVRVDNKGKGELKWAFNAENVGGFGFALDQFDCVALLIIGKKGLIAPLIGYKNKEVQWKNNLSLTDRELVVNESLPDTPMQVPIAVPSGDEDRKNIVVRGEEPVIELSMDESKQTVIEKKEENVSAPPEIELRHSIEVQKEEPVAILSGNEVQVAKIREEETDIIHSGDEAWQNIEIQEEPVSVSQDGEVQLDLSTQESERTIEQHGDEIQQDMTVQEESIIELYGDEVQQDTAVQENDLTIELSGDEIQQNIAVQKSEPSIELSGDEAQQDTTVQESEPAIELSEDKVQQNIEIKEMESISVQSGNLVRHDIVDQEDESIITPTGNEPQQDITIQEESVIGSSEDEVQYNVAARESECAVEPPVDELTQDENPNNEQPVVEDLQSITLLEETSVAFKQVEAIQEKIPVAEEFFEEAKRNTASKIEVDIPQYIAMNEETSYESESLPQHTSNIISDSEKTRDEAAKDILTSNHSSKENGYSYEEDYMKDNLRVLPLTFDEIDEKTGQQNIYGNAYASSGPDLEDAHKSFKQLIERFRKEMEELDNFKLSFQEEESQKKEKPQIYETTYNWAQHSLGEIIKNNIELRPFKRQSRDVRWVRISLQEIEYLPAGRSLCESSFLLDAYKQYKHLILGLVDDRSGRQYILGVPGVYDFEYRVLPAQLGFVQFKCCDDISPYQGAYGYWLMPVDA